MSTNERIRILTLLKEGKITVEESGELLEALEPAVQDNPSNDWLKKTLHNLTCDGFVITENVSLTGGTMRAVARRSRFELTKFGFSETFFVFREFESISTDALRGFSSEAFALAKRSKAIALPCGLFESVWCFAVAITNRVEDAAIVSVRYDEPTKHYAAAEMPVILHQTSGKLYYFENTPLWGAAYYAGFRVEIQRHLGHAARG